MVQNHLYMMTIEGRGVKATAATTKLLVRGSYTICLSRHKSTPPVHTSCTGGDCFAERGWHHGQVSAAMGSRRSVGRTDQRSRRRCTPGFDARCRLPETGPLVRLGGGGDRRAPAWASWSRRETRAIIRRRFSGRHDGAAGQYPAGERSAPLGEGQAALGAAGRAAAALSARRTWLGQHGRGRRACLHGKPWRIAGLGAALRSRTPVSRWTRDVLLCPG